ncbi:MAG: AAA family ATPase [Flavobacteriaceae bacterium]|jgi:predicted ATP-dependent serine protease|nr:AAA family ATPase [Flavobacteriaceae bacterium]
METFVTPIEIETSNIDIPKIINYKDYVFTFGKKIEVPKILMSVKTSEYGRTPIFTEGSLSLILGKQNSKKTAFILTIIQAFMNTFNEKLETNFSGIKILYVDTEQSEYYVSKNAEKIRQMTNADDFQKMNERIIYFRSNELTSDQKKQAVEDILDEHKIDYVILDNISDFLKDYNSSEESTSLKLWITSLLNRTKTHLTCVIHETAGIGKAKGHIGSLLEQFAETTLQITEDKENRAVSRIYPKKLRDRKFGEFGITFNNYGLPYLTSLEIDDWTSE